MRRPGLSKFRFSVVFSDCRKLFEPGSQRWQRRIIARLYYRRLKFYKNWNGPARTFGLEPDILTNVRDPFLASLEPGINTLLMLYAL